MLRVSASCSSANRVHGDGGLVHVPGGVKRWHVDTGRLTATPILVLEPVKRVKRKARSAPVCGNQDAIAQRSSLGLAFNRANRRTVEPAAAHLQAKTTHPSPSAREFRLLINELAVSALRRMFCSCRQLRGTLPSELSSREMGACPCGG
jgi:hypothetical protein